MHSSSQLCLLLWACSALVLVLCGSALAEEVHVPPYRQAERAITKRVDTLASQTPSVIHDYELSLATPANRTLRTAVTKNVTASSSLASTLLVDLRTNLAEQEFTSFVERIQAEMALGEVRLLQRLYRTIAVELSAVEEKEPVSGALPLLYVHSEAISVAQVLLQRSAAHMWDHVHLLDSSLKQALKPKDGKVNATARAEVLDRFTALHTALGETRASLASTYYPEVERLRALQGAQLSLLQVTKLEIELDLLAVMDRFARQYRAEFVLLNPAEEPTPPAATPTSSSSLDTV